MNLSNLNWSCKMLWSLFQFRKKLINLILYLYFPALSNSRFVIKGFILGFWQSTQNYRRRARYFGSSHDIITFLVCLGLLLAKSVFLWLKTCMTMYYFLNTFNIQKVSQKMSFWCEVCSSFWKSHLQKLWFLMKLKKIWKKKHAF